MSDVCESVVASGLTSIRILVEKAFFREKLFL